MTKNIKQRLNFQVPIMEVKSSKDETNDFIIKGTAINATTTSNGHKFLTEELESAANTLTGVPLLKDHKNEIDSIMGRVEKGEYNDKKIEFTAKVIDKKAQEMIADGRLNSVSVGAELSSFELDETDDTYVPRGIIFRELSLVAVGADDGATFGMALNEAFKLTTDIKKEGKIMAEKNELAPEMVTKEELDTVVAKAVAEALVKDAEQRKVVEAEATEKEAAEKEIADKADADKAEAEKEAEEKEAEEKLKLELAEEASAPYKIEQGNGSLRGGSFSVMRG